MCPQTGKFSTAKEVCFMNNPTHKYTRTLTYLTYSAWYSRSGQSTDYRTVKVLRSVSSRGSLRDVFNLGCPKAASFMSPNAGLRGLSQWIQLCTWSPNKLCRSKVDHLTPYLAYVFGLHFGLVGNTCPCPWRRGERRPCRRARRRDALAPPPSACLLRGQRSSLHYKMWKLNLW